ncbi:MAG TPA: tetratricopeptide repeat protein [Thermoanaerobaculia bacterium]
MTVFISHATEDDDFVRTLCETLEHFGEEGWIDSREIRGGDPLASSIEQAIDQAEGTIVVVSPHSLQSKWVGRELQHALDVRRRRPEYRVIPISLDGTKLGLAETLFGEEPAYIPASSEAGGVEAALDDILVALGRRLAADVAELPQPKAEPLEELVLELSDLKFVTDDKGNRRATAKARLVYEPAKQEQRPVESVSAWRFIAPLGPIEAEELRWYLETYAGWPSGYFRDRAQRVEQSLIEWGQRLHEKTMPLQETANVMQAWARIDQHADRRLSVEIDAALETGAPADDVQAARECATLLLGLPWELLHDGKTRVRRRMPNTRVLDVPVVVTPIRILLITARPEDESCPYIDHRASALPLVDATESLGGLVQLRLLDPPTLPALREELDRARRARMPYHVIHFDGHGVYDRHAGLGALCFEDPQDVEKLDGRRHEIVDTRKLGELLSEHRIPLVFLEACQTAMSDKASESVASELLKVGVASVVAMSHSVLVETARRFVSVFYRELAAGRRVGDAMLAGQRNLKDESFRGHVLGEDDLHLHDWFVPVLYQEQADPQLFRATPARQTREDTLKALQTRLGALPEPPQTGFIGRSRELLSLQRLLRANGKGRYAVVRGQGGEGKTALAVEFARWMVRSQQMRRAAFVSVESHSNALAVLDAVGQQLVAKYSVAAFKDIDAAIQPVERALKEQSTLLVIDNMESILLPPYVETSPALAADARADLEAILALCARLNAIGETRLVFTSREPLPTPFDGERNRRELHRLDRDDAVAFVERVLNVEGQGTGAAANAARESIEQLVDAVNCHARTLTLLAPSLRQQGADATRLSLTQLMEEMEQRYPGNREQSLYASVALSLQRMSPENRERARVLGVFHGGVDLDMLRVMTQWEKTDVASLAQELIETGLATPDPYNHLTLNPALPPYLRGTLDATEREALVGRWAEEMLRYAGFLYEQQFREAEIASTLTLLELPNLFALLDCVQRRGDAEATINLTTKIYSLMQYLGKPRLLNRVGEARDAAAGAMGEAWNHARSQAERSRIEQLLQGGRLRGALDGAERLLQRASTAGETAYPDADYDLALAGWLLARVLRFAGGPQRALPLLETAQERFEGRGAARMASACITERGDCLRDLGRLEDAASAYEEAIARDEEDKAERDVAVGKGQLGTVRLGQRRYEEALTAYTEARERFTQLDEPGSVATIWHQTGMVYQDMGATEAAEETYRKSLALKVRLGDVAGQADTLSQLGNLYDDVLGHPEEAAAFYFQAATKYVELKDEASEGLVRNNLAETLRKLSRLDEARREIARATECRKPLGHAGEIWASWCVLSRIETDSGDPAAAASAKRKAIEAYLAYRRDGGENHYNDGRLALAVTQVLLAGEREEAASELQQIAADPDLPAWLRPFVEALQSIVAGSRDRALADAPDLGYRMVAEILFLIETLEQQAQGSTA